MMLDLQLFYLDGWSDDITTKSQRRAATKSKHVISPKRTKLSKYITAKSKSVGWKWGGSGEEIKKHIIIIFVSFKSF
jgi:hypothetical protein